MPAGSQIKPRLFAGAFVVTNATFMNNKRGVLTPPNCQTLNLK